MTQVASQPFYEFPVKEPEPPRKASYDGPPIQEVYSQFFGQTAATTDCVVRSLWIILTLSNSKQSSYEYIPYADFYQALSWLDARGLAMFDAFRILRYYGFQHRFTIPIEAGTYIIAGLVSGAHHCVVYSNGTLYDSARILPVRMTIKELQEMISQPTGDFGNLINVAEVF